ncbi:MAG: hypothetical protein WCO97_11345 [bacterium]
MRRKNNVSVALLCASATFLAYGSLARATLAPHAPSLSVHESRYGTVIHASQRENIQGLEIKIVSRADHERIYQVQCFFLKRGKKDASITVDDAVIFDVVNPHGTYEVIARPIKVSGVSPPKTAGNSKSKSGKSSKTSRPDKSQASESPREGYVVRILCDGEILRTHCSGHALEKLLEQDPSLLEQTARKKSVRHLEANGLLKR